MQRREAQVSVIEEERASGKEASTPSKGKSTGDKKENKTAYMARPQEVQ